MARANQDTGLAFGLASFAVLQNSQLIASSEITGSFTCDINPEFITTVGGPSSYPIASRLGRASAEGSMVIRERPDWVDVALTGGASTDITAVSAAAAGSVTNVVGTSLQTLQVTVATSVANVIDFQVTATGATTVNVKFTGSFGAQDFNGITVSTTATQIGNTGVSIATSSSPAFTENDIAVFRVNPAHGGIKSVTIPQIRFENEYELRVFSARGSSGTDNITEYRFPRAVFRGAPINLEDVNVVETEVPFMVLAPSDGGNICTRTILTTVAQ